MDVFYLHNIMKEEGVGSPFSVALGNFDGVHIGHTELIKKAVLYAKQNKIPSSVLTFSENIKSGATITSTAQKLEIFDNLGVDAVFLAEFSEIKDYSPEAFVNDILKKKCGAVGAFCGYNFHFGKGGLGNAELLKELMQPYDTIICEPVMSECVPVSSTAIRLLLGSGEVEAAAKLLGRKFYIDAPIYKGKQLGRTIGIPTVNQRFTEGKSVLGGGVYACKVYFDGMEYIGCANVGVRPTDSLDKHEINCETHILGYYGDLYGKNVRVEFYHRIRSEIKFDSLEDLVCQVKKDIENTEEYFKLNN